MNGICICYLSNLGYNNGGWRTILSDIVGGEWIREANGSSSCRENPHKPSEYSLWETKEPSRARGFVAIFNILYSKFDFSSNFLYYWFSIPLQFDIMREIVNWFIF